MRRIGWGSGIGLTVLAVVFTVGLTFASIELPALLHAALEESVPTPDGDSHADGAAQLRLELFLRHYHLRTIGYACFGLMVVLIVAGFVIGRSGLAVAGAAMMFLPVFAQFATVMFFLAGLGLLNLVWLPVLDLSFDIGQLGDVVYLPYRALVWGFARIGLGVHGPVVTLLIGGGLLLFTLGTLAWFVARSREGEVADFWVYRISRHPQYLGWIVWSYGMLLALQRVRYPRRSWGIPASLPWLLAAMVIVGVALLEERQMRRAFGERYQRYRAHTPFLLPLPGWLSRLFTAPSRLLFGKSLPERGGEIAAVLAIYTLILAGLSWASLEVRGASRLPPAVRAEGDTTARAEALVQAVRRADTWHRRAPLVTALESMGEPAVDPLLGLLGDPDAELRGIAATSLGRIGSQRAVDPLVARLTDPDGGVRHRAALSLGELKAAQAVGPLIGMLAEEGGTTRYAAAVALGRIGSAEAVDALIAVLGDPRPWTRAAVVTALGQLGAERAVGPLLALLDDAPRDVHVRRAIVVAFAQIGSPRTETALREALADEDLEVRVYAAEALRSLGDRR